MIARLRLLLLHGESQTFSKIRWSRSQGAKVLLSLEDCWDFGSEWGRGAVVKSLLWQLRDRSLVFECVDERQDSSLHAGRDTT